MSIMRADKKVKDGRVRRVLPDRLGAVSVVVVDDTPSVATAAAWDAVRF